MGLIPGIGGNLARNDASFLSVIQTIGLGANLGFCLDAGDFVSYGGGSAQQWTDVSGSGNHFYRGTTSGSEATDPTFTGTAGALTSGEYFAMDGGDLFSLVGSNPTFIADAHKDNALFTVGMWVYLANVVTDAQTLFATYARGNVATRGWGLFCINNGLIFNVDNDPVKNFSVNALTVGWNLAMVSINEADGTTNGAHLRVNGTTQTATGTYTSPSTSAATSRLFAGANTNSNFKISSGGRMGGMFGWSSALTVAQTNTFFQATRGRYGV